MQAQAVIMEGPKRLSLATLPLRDPGEGDVVVAVSHSGISTGTEKLLWTGDMPDFPGMGYPLVPGYEAVGHVVEASAGALVSEGDQVFVPGGNCFSGVRGLFGAASDLIVSPSSRVVRVNTFDPAQGALLALAATAYHALNQNRDHLPELIVGHGVLGRLLARLTLALGGPPPMVWEVDQDRLSGAEGYPLYRPEDDPRRDYQVIFDATGDVGVIDQLVKRLALCGELVLAGFYADRVSFDFPTAFMKQARFRVAAEWSQLDLFETQRLLERGAFNLDGLITHHYPAERAAEAYELAFTDRSCLKMILDWESAA
ncbi:MAG: chlorophyll synthesis pathway protein BchC [Pseudomonadota bacterium]